MKRSIIWKIDKEELTDIVRQSDTITKILLHFGLSNKGGNFRTLKSRLKYDKIDYSHIRVGRGSNKDRKYSSWKKIPTENILVVNSTYNRCHLKNRLLKEGLIENKCAVCGIGPVWQDQPLSLQLDHINGISNDDRLENLRLLCPNCHSQTGTFSGKTRHE